MSGPTSVLLGADPFTILISATAIRAAEAISAGYQEAEQLNGRHRARRDENAAMQRASILHGEQALRHQLADEETRFSQLVMAAERLGVADKVLATKPAQPDSNDPMMMAAYVQGLRMLADELASHLLTESALRMDKLGSDHALIDIPAELAVAQIQRPGQGEATQTGSARLLARVAHLGAVPENIEAVARELDGTPSGERADLLLMELRARIHAWVVSLQKRMVQDATAIVVDQTLKELGYQVEEIGNTLFVEGGVVHFRRKDWGEYMVRMRVNAEAGTANFNVIRSVKDGNREASIRDHLAEDRWCAEFPALKGALEARGVRLTVRRQLAAGEVPVQLVEPDKLPTFAGDEAPDTIRQLKSLSIEAK